MTTTSPPTLTCEVVLHCSGIGTGLYQISGDCRGRSCKRIALATSNLMVGKSYSSGSQILSEEIVTGDALCVCLHVFWT